jgi:hypothetical protein
MTVRGEPVVWRIALFVLVVSAIFWLGSTNARALIGNDMLKPGTVEFEEYLAPEAEREVFRLISVVWVVIMISYVVTLISSILFLSTSPYRLKEHGWLLMSAILFYVFVPVEVYTMILDGKMIYKEFFTTADNAVFRELFVARVKALAGAPVIAVLCYYTVIGLAVFQPLKKRPSPPHEE